MPGWSHYWPEPTELAPFTLSPVGVGMESAKTRPIRDRTLEATGVIIVNRGTGWYARHGSNPVPVTGPTLLWLDPDVPHSYRPDPKWDEQWLLFGGSGARVYRELDWSARERGVIPVTETIVERISWLIGELRTETAYPGRSSLLRASVLMQRVLLLVDQAAITPEANLDQEVLRQLAEDATRPLSITERAAKVGLSVSKLRALTARSAGESPQSVVEGIRIMESKRLLAESDLTIQQVSRLVGYEDPAYFSRVFRDSVGVPPSQYRDRSR